MKVILVDDEYVIRVGMRSMIDWNELGCEIVAEAANGEAALELIRTKEPDIVVTDIKMPVMNGIELMQCMEGMRKRPKFLVLSNYNDFHYVKEAMKYGAEDYLLKLEMDPMQLADCLEKIIIKIENERSHDHHPNRSALTVNGLRAIQKELFKNILNGIYTDESYIMDKKEAFGINLDFKGCIYCMTIKIGELYRFEDVSDDELHMLNFSVINIVEEILRDRFDVHCFEGKTSEFIVLATAKKDSRQRLANPVLSEQARLLREMLEQYLNVTAVISVGVGGPRLSGLHKAYKQAVLNMRQRYFVQVADGVLLGENETTLKVLDEVTAYDYKERLFKGLSFRKKDEIDDIFETLRTITGGKQVGKSTVCNLVLELYSILREYEESYQLGDKSIINRCQRTYQELVYINHVSEALKWIDLVYQDIQDYLNQSDEYGYNKLISRVKEYIHNHFDEELYLGQVAEEVNLNPSYFSTLLKQYTGMSYSEYVIWERIEEAKNLLAQTDLKVYEVGEKVGYQNIYYFSRIFKKKTGLTPGEYKKNIPGRKLG